MTNKELQEKLKQFPDWVPICVNNELWVDAAEPIMQKGPSADGVGAVNLFAMMFEE